MSAHRQARLTISKSALLNNLALIRRALGHRRLIAVIKANAYGHGLTQVARLFSESPNGTCADLFAVATVDEAVALREDGLRTPILVLGGTPNSAVPEAIARHIALTVYDEPLLRAMQAEAAKRESVAHAHVKIDTGMHRIGVTDLDSLKTLLSAWRDAPNVKMEGIFTHFCDAEDEAFTERQNERFVESTRAVLEAGYRPFRHAAASLPIAQQKYLYDGARPGIALYGCSVRNEMPDLIPAQTLSAYPVRFAWIEPGESVGYGRTFTAARTTRVMTLPIGYGDGYLRALSGRAQALIRGARVPLIGRVCMDQIMFDVTDVPEADYLDEVVLMGAQGADRITPDELADWANTIPYEILLSFHTRLRREVID